MTSRTLRTLSIVLSIVAPVPAWAANDDAAAASDPIADADQTDASADTISAASATSAVASKLFREGRDLARSGDLASACERFRASYQLAVAPGTLLNLALCERDLGHLALAWSHLHEVLALLPTTDERRALAESQLSELRRRLPWLTLSLAPSAAEARITLDGALLPRASFNEALPLDVGEHVIVVEREGHQPRRYLRALDVAERATVVVEAGAPLVRPVTQNARPKARPLAHPVRVAVDAPELRPSRTWVYATGALALALVGTGFVLRHLGDAEQDTVNGNCADGYCTDTGLAADDRQRVYRKLATAAFIGGGVALGTGIALWFAASPEPARGAKAALGAGSFIVSGQF